MGDRTMIFNQGKTSPSDSTRTYQNIKFTNMSVPSKKTYVRAKKKHCFFYLSLKRRYKLLQHHRWKTCLSDGLFRIAPKCMLMVLDAQKYLCNTVLHRL